MKRRQDFAYNLHNCQIFFPPQVFLELRTHCAEHVVDVHNYVNKRVNYAQEGCVTTCENCLRDFKIVESCLVWEQLRRLPAKYFVPMKAANGIIAWW